MWIYVPTIESSTCSAATAALPSASGWPDLIPQPSATSSGTNTARKSSNNVSETDCSTMLPSGTTSSPSTGDPGVDAWILSLAASPANLTALQGREKLPEDCLTTETSGPIRSDSLARWDQASSSWRTSQASLFQMEDGQHMGEPWSESFPKSGMTRSGCLYPLPKRERPTSGSGGGLWPTPNAHEDRAEKYTLETSERHLREGRQIHLAQVVRMFPTPSTMDHIDRKHMRPSRAATNRTTGYLSEMIGQWPTPTSTERSGTNPKTGKGEGLSKTVKLLPTPNSRDYKDTLNSKPNRQIHLVDAIRQQWPTPKSRDWKGGMGTDPDRQLHDLDKIVKLFPTPTGDDADNVTRASGAFQSLTRTVMEWPTPTTSQIHKPVRPLCPAEAGGTHGISLVGKLGDVAPELIGGSLSPDWVSWLMGLPVGWTSLEPMPRREYLDWLHAQLDGTWWDEERGLPRVSTGIKDRVNRLKCLGNGIVPASLALFLRR